jgi:hypothetical protein
MANGAVSKLRRGQAWRGVARHGKARRGLARRGRAWGRMTNSFQITATWDGHAFSPDHVFAEECAALPRNGQVRITVEPHATEAQRLQLRWWWALLSEICASGIWDQDKESLQDFIKIGIGWGKWYPLDNGTCIFVPRSISPARCSPNAFRRFIWFAERFLADRLNVDTGAVFAAIDMSVGPAPRLHAQPISENAAECECPYCRDADIRPADCGNCDGYGNIRPKASDGHRLQSGADY